VEQTTQLDVYKKNGLTEEEAVLLDRWVQDGKPGLIKYRAEHLARIYVLGYTTAELSKWFPDTPYECILWCKVHYKWDELRNKHLSATSERALSHAVVVKNEAIRLLADILSATHVAWRQKLMDYLSNPDKNPAPEFLPKSLMGYNQLLTLLNEQIGQGKDSENKPQLPMVQVNLGNRAQDFEIKAAKDVLAAKVKKE
jgi:hypothetical protein